jgi:hypothetical protein
LPYEDSSVGFRCELDYNFQIFGEICFLRVVILKEATILKMGKSFL